MAARAGAKRPRLKKRAWLGEPRLGKVLVALNESGETRIAGGAVRNALLGEEVGEVDLATVLKPEEVVRIGTERGFGVRPIGLEHGTVMLVVDGRPFEVTALRVDVETFGRRARVEFTDDWEADAARRDFTMNALYCDLKGRVFDPLGALQDLRRGRVRFVGEPAERIREDHLRILRFFRFNAQYGRGAPDPVALRQCRKDRALVRTLSAERVRQELYKLVTAPRAARAVQWMADGGILQLVLGRFDSVAALERMARADRLVPLTPDPLLRVCCLHSAPLELSEKLRMTRAEIARLEALEKASAPGPELRPAERKVVLYQLGRQAFLDQARLAWARSPVGGQGKQWRKLLRFGATAAVPVFPLKGKDLMARGVKPGPDMGQALRRLEDWWIASGFPGDKETILARLSALERSR